MKLIGWMLSFVLKFARCFCSTGAELAIGFLQGERLLSLFKTNQFTIESRTFKNHGVFIVDLYIRAGLTVLATFLQQVIGETLADKEDE